MFRKSVYQIGQTLAANREKKHAARCAANIAAHAEILEKCDELAALPVDPCPACGLTLEHLRCRKCGACCTAPINEIRDCTDCGLKAARSNFRGWGMPAFIPWRPTESFAKKIGREFAAHIRKGIKPSEKQIALAEKLAAEDHGAKRTSGKLPVLDIILWSKAWKPVLALVNARAGWVLAPDFEQMVQRARTEWSTYPKDQKEIAKLCSQTISDSARKLIEEATGYSVLVTADDFADALKGAVGDELLTRALEALYEDHCFRVKEKKMIESPCRHGHRDCLRVIDHPEGTQPNHAVAWECRKREDAGHATAKIGA